MSQPASALVQFSRFFEAQQDTFVESRASLAARAQQESGQRHYTLGRAAGQGWVDLHQFGNGIMLGRMQCRLAQTLDAHYQAFPDNVMLGLMVHGKTRTLSQSNRQQLGQEGDIFLRNADPGAMRSHIPDGLQASISIDIPRSMLDTLHEQGVDTQFLGKRDSHVILRPNGHMADVVRDLGQRILALHTERSLLNRLALESLSLDLLVKLLSCGASALPTGNGLASRRWTGALDDAIDILHAEWDQPLTIACLARRAGINECYLKTLFRQRTGQTIAAYLRDLRMQHARGMIESGRYGNLLHVAHACGYARADKFSQAFHRAHGVLPSQLR